MCENLYFIVALILYFFINNYSRIARYRWLTCVILGTQVAEIRRIVVQHQSGQIVHETPSHKGAGGGAQGVGPKFKPQYCKKKNKIKLQQIRNGYKFSDNPSLIEEFVSLPLNMN
jgi:hypothetical protein